MTITDAESSPGAVLQFEIVTIFRLSFLFFVCLRMMMRICFSDFEFLEAAVVAGCFCAPIMTLALFVAPNNVEKLVPESKHQPSLARAHSSAEQD